MKKVIVSTLVGSIIFFVYQSAMWVGGVHKDLWIHNAKQDTVLQQMTGSNFQEGLYYIPSADPASKDAMKENEAIMKANVGKPWAMVFYHTSASGMEAGNIAKGFLYTMLAVLIASLVVYNGRFGTFGARFLAGWAFGLFTLLQGVLPDINWWSYPWNFMKPHFVDLTVGWALCALWLAFYLKNKDAVA